MDISIVTGTYNRLASLQTLLATIRQSFTPNVHGLVYEVILVDGGSTDGTIEWCKQQPDVRLIEQGALLGAVRAFNDGAYAAQGQYVILANDDIEFLDQSVLNAYLYMQDHPDCGCGCFYQDRGRTQYEENNPHKYQVEVMPCVHEGKQVHWPYGQVCIIPKWLGDTVGWWCRDEDYTRLGLKPLVTYGGDNELSAKIYEIGYKISPIPGSRIHDKEIDDALRQRNNVERQKEPRFARHHPDSWNWGRRWTHFGTRLTGPVIRDEPMYDNPIAKKERILYLPLFEQGWAVQKEQKHGLRDALAKVAIVDEFDYLSRTAAVSRSGMLEELRREFYRFQPTLFLSQIHNADVINAGDILALKSSFPFTTFINWNGDVWPQNLMSEGGIQIAKVMDLQLIINREILDKYQEMGIAADYWQIGWEPDGIGHDPDTVHDVVFLATGYSKQRQELGRFLKNLSGVDVGLYGAGWPKDWSKGACMYDFITACKIYRGAKISIGDSQWPDTGFVSNRVFQALAAGGSALAHQWFKDMDKLGLEDGKTCIIWCELLELETKIRYYLSHEDERKAVAEAGEKLALERHSFETRVKELFTILDNRGIIGEVESWR